MTGLLFEKEKENVGKGDNAGYQNLLFQKNFKRAFYSLLAT